MESPETSPLALPNDISLPFFAYGAFKPGQLAFGQLREFLSEKPVPALASGSLKIRDGLPLFKPEHDGSVQGYVLTFRAQSFLEAYEIICRFEPKSIYSWEESLLSSPPTTTVNLLVGRKMMRGRPNDLETGSWSFQDDPVFKYGLPVIKETAETLASHPFESSPPEEFDWSRFFRLQMAYLLLWSAIERFSTFAYGPTLSPLAKVKKLGCDPRFLAAFKQRVSGPEQRISDSRDPGRGERLSVDNPEEAAEYYYQVRSNLSHRGKGAWSDGEIVRDALNDLFAIFNDILASTSKTHDPA